ncbi:MAG: M56 family metallopeptidase [Firmicutes bacterium]|nr:M56 family metallopeptidase [Bacillota bacterium]
MLSNIFMISLSMSAVILLLLIISPILNKRYSAKWRYFVWLILAVRLIIPFKAELPSAPVNIPPMQNQTVAFKAEGIPFAIMDESFAELGNNSPHSADYAHIITMGELLNIIWALGAICFLFYHFLSYIIFKRKVKPYCNKIENETFGDILNAMQIKAKPQLLQCGKIASPMMIGFIKPTILLPSTNYSNDELTVILKHELTHFKRGDLWYKLILVIANAIHWFNPMIYLMAHQANRDMEYSCDDAVIKDSDMDYRKAYSMTILKAMQNDDTTTLSTNFSESGKRVKKRFDNILNIKLKKTGIAALICIIIIIPIVSSLTAYNKQSDEITEISQFSNRLYRYNNTSIYDVKRLNKLFDAFSLTMYDSSLDNLEVKSSDELVAFYKLHLPMPMMLNTDSPRKLVTIAFALLDDINKVQFIFDYKGILTTYTYKRETILSTTYRTSHNTATFVQGFDSYTASKKDFQEFVYSVLWTTYQNNDVLEEEGLLSYQQQTIDIVNYWIANAYSRYYEITNVSATNYNAQLQADKITATLIYTLNYKTEKGIQQQIFDIKMDSPLLENGTIDTNQRVILARGDNQSEYVPVETFFPKGDE